VARVGRLPAYLALARAPNAAISAGAVLLGAWFAGGRLDARVWAAALAGAALTAFANADNDVCDFVLDRAAHPSRPIPSGALSRADAHRFAWISAVTGVLASAWVSASLGWLSAGVAINMALYNRATSRSAALKNLTVAVLASLPFVYGAWTVGHPAPGVRLALVAVPLHFAREVAKDIDDAGADLATRRTLPIVLGRRVAALFISAAIALFILASLWLAGRRAYLLAPAALVAARAALLAWRGERGAPGLFKAAMLAAMAGAVTLRSV